MIIAVGTYNTIKLQALAEVIQLYPQLASAEIHSFSVSSEITEQPLSIEETIRGAKNRASNAYAACRSCAYSVGIESGLLDAPGTSSGFLEACVSCIFDGKEHHIGLSCGFEVPPFILKRVIDEKMDLGQACYSSGITDNAKLGQAEGLVGILTSSRITRKEYTKQSLITAFIRLEHHNWYSKNRDSAELPSMHM